MHDGYVFLVPVVLVSGYASAFTSIGLSWNKGEIIPDAACPAIRKSGSFNLVGGCGGADEKVFR